MIDAAVRTILHGGVVILPTDTVYGIACDAFCNFAKERIYQIKKRPTKKHFPLMFGSFSDLKEFADLSIFQENLIRRFLPGPFTFIVKTKQTTRLLPGKIAVRIPNCQVVLKVLANLRHPIVATSANISGQKELTHVCNLSLYLKNKVDFILKYHKKTNGVPSAILDISEDKIKVIRSNKSALGLFWSKF